MNTWTTKDGAEIEISKMTNEHLLNTIKMIEKLAKDGLAQDISLGYAPDNDYIEYDCITLYGKEVFEHFNPEYKNLKEEAKNRKLQIKSTI